MIEIIGGFLLIIIIFILLFWLKKTLFVFGFFFKIISLLFVILIVGSILVSYYVITDANNFKNNFSNSTNLFLLKESVNGTNEIITGIAIHPGNVSLETITRDQLDQMQKYYNSGNMDSLNTQYYKVFVIDTEALGNISQISINGKDVNLTGDEAREILLSSTPRETLAGIVAKKSGTDASLELSSLKATDDEVKGFIFSYYLTDIFNPQNIAHMLISLKNNGIQVYKQTALFTAIKFIPEQIISLVAK